MLRPTIYIPSRLTKLLATPLCPYRFDTVLSSGSSGS
jgi:hypothetical protein